MTISESILVHADRQRCFDLSIRIELVQKTLGFLPTPRSGAVHAGSRVVWEGRAFGMRHQHHTLITAFDEPRFFQDTQEKGSFASFHHDHLFRETQKGTWLEDTVCFRLPWYFGGCLAERLLLAPYIRSLMQQRFQLLKALAEDATAPLFS